MLNYKGHEIPDTFKEIWKKAVDTSPMTPYNGLIYNLERGIRIGIPISFEEIRTAKGNKEEEDKIVRMYVDVVKTFISNQEEIEKRKRMGSITAPLSFYSSSSMGSSISLSVTCTV